MSAAYELAKSIGILQKNIKMGREAESLEVLKVQAAEVLIDVRNTRTKLPHIMFICGETSTRLLDRIQQAAIEVLTGNMAFSQRQARLGDALRNLQKLIRGLDETPKWSVNIKHLYQPFMPRHAAGSAQNAARQ